MLPIIWFFLSSKSSSFYPYFPLSTSFHSSFPRSPHPVPHSALFFLWYNFFYYSPLYSSLFISLRIPYFLSFDHTLFLLFSLFPPPPTLILSILLLIPSLFSSFSSPHPVHPHLHPPLPSLSTLSVLTFFALFIVDYPPSTLIPLCAIRSDFHLLCKISRPLREYSCSGDASRWPLRQRRAVVLITTAAVITLYLFHPWILVITHPLSVSSLCFFSYFCIFFLSFHINSRCFLLYYDSWWAWTTRVVK